MEKQLGVIMMMGESPTVIGTSVLTLSSQQGILPIMSHSRLCNKHC